MKDYEYAQKAFEEYLNHYDRTDDKIRLKIIHTYHVAECSEQIARRMGLPEEDTELAKLIGLLHDIGRFEQIKRFDSFMPETMNHAEFGAELLFGEEKMIRKFLETDAFDDVIYTAVLHHSDFRLEGVKEGRTLLHAKLIRDADKLDNCRVKLEESIETLLGVSEEEAGKGMISPKVWASCAAGETVLSADRVTKPDFWISYMAQYFDLNFAASADMIKEQHYLERIASRISYEEKDTEEKIWETVRKVKEMLYGKKNRNHFGYSRTSET